VFKINREASFSYEVKISPLYEYSYIIFLFAVKYANTKLKEIFITTLAVLFIFQDTILGGRVTSLQIMLVFAITLFYKYITIKRILLFAFVGVLFLSVIGSYRANYSYNENIVANTFLYLKKNMFVLDTVTYAYGAGITQLYAADFISVEDRVISFYNYCINVILGSSYNFSEILNKETITNIPATASNYHINYGGSVFPIYFYFWFGWLGVIISGILTSKYIAFFSKQKSELGSLIFLAIIVTVPRWYLYSPLALFRGPLVLLPLLFFLLKFIEHVFSIRNKTKKTINNF
jgi:hypothetical protein